MSKNSKNSQSGSKVRLRRLKNKLPCQHHKVLGSALKQQSILSVISAYIIKIFIFLSLLLSALWLGFIMWFHFADYPLFKVVFGTVAFSAVTITLLGFMLRHPYWVRVLLGYAALWLAAATWFVLLPAKQDRMWQPQVARALSVTRDDTNPDIVTLHNVRDFSWKRSDGVNVSVQSKIPSYKKLADDAQGIEVVEERWHSRTIDMSKLSGLDVINSYWMGPEVAHTLISFRFIDERPLTFSVEIRKENGESFSALAGFFRQFEMSLIAAEERDILYTRSNVRGEHVYIFPIRGVTINEVRGLFESYLNRAETLQRQPQWYNTLTSNCTNVVFEMARQVSGGRLPIDYRIWMSGYLPNYLFDMGLLSSSDQESNETNDVKDNYVAEHWTVEEWYQHAYINPKVAELSFAENNTSYVYSQLIRQNLPVPIFSTFVSKSHDRRETNLSAGRQ